MNFIDISKNDLRRLKEIKDIKAQQTTKRAESVRISFKED